MGGHQAPGELRPAVEKPSLKTDIAVVGAGAAGLTAAIWAGRTLAGSGKKARVELLDSRKKIGAKILISGGTRCNVTHRTVRASDYGGGPSHFVRHVLEAFTPSETIRFFEEIGVKLILEPTGKYFPTTHSGKTVLEALLRELSRQRVPLTAGAKLISAERTDDGFRLSGEEDGVPREWRADRLVLCTGGLSYPETGSDGTGLAMARSFGHTVRPTAPALTPLLSEDADWAALSGVSIPAVKLSFFEHGRKKAEAEGGFLFTHFGFSGPAALDLSRHVAYAAQNRRPYEVKADFLCGASTKLPHRFMETLLAKVGKNRLKQALKEFPLPVKGVFGYRKAEVTAGGVDLKEVSVSTMGSKKVPGLYFAGEMLDIDGRIGGFNFQWAWSTGAIAGKAAAKSLT